MNERFNPSKATEKAMEGIQWQFPEPMKPIERIPDAINPRRRWSLIGKVYDRILRDPNRLHELHGLGSEFECGKCCWRVEVK